MLRATRLLNWDGIEIADVICEQRGGVADEHATGNTIVLARRAWFVRSVEGIEIPLDPTVASCMNPDEVQPYGHTHDHGDDCTTVVPLPGLVPWRSSGGQILTPEPLPTWPGMASAMEGSGTH